MIRTTALKHAAQLTSHGTGFDLVFADVSSRYALLMRATDILFAVLRVQQCRDTSDARTRGIKGDGGEELWPPQVFQRVTCLVRLPEQLSVAAFDGHPPCFHLIDITHNLYAKVRT